MINFGTYRAMHVDDEGTPNLDSSTTAHQGRTRNRNSSSDLSVAFQNIDASQSTVITHRLSENNYLQWSHNVLMFIRGRGKEKYLTGEAVCPDESDQTYETWKAENNQVMTWLVNSMTAEVSTQFVLATSAKEIWEDARTTYATLENTAALFQIQSILRETKQGEKSITQYYTTLTKLWQQLDLYDPQQWRCAEDLNCYRKIVERGRIYDLLLGLNPIYEDVRGRIMATRPLPTLKEAVNLVKCEESRKTLVRNFSTTQQVPEISALAARNTNEYVKRKSGKWCDHCQRNGHTRETCWKLHGKPNQNQKPRLERKAFVGAGEKSDHENSTISKEEIEMLKNLLNKFELKPENVVATSNLANTGKIHTALSTMFPQHNIWLVDSGANEHMTGDITLIKDFQPCYDEKYIRVANGQALRVHGTGTAVLSETMILINVLYAPGLDCNLLSVSKVTKFIGCSAKFCDTGCIFQDLKLGKRIGSAEEFDGLYYIKGLQTNKVSNVAFHSNKIDNVILWHYRLGHPSFNYMKFLYPELFNKNDVPFQCEICQFSKHTKNSYPSRSYEPTKPFSLVHSDIWGPSKVKTHKNAKWFVTFIDDHSRLTWVYLMKEKAEVFQIFKAFHSMILNQFQTNIQILRSDNAKEYLSTVFNQYLTQQGIIHQTSCVNTPQQNGIVERKNRHLLEVARTLMLTHNVPSYLWGDAILTSAYLINRMPSKTLKFRTPLQVLMETYSSVPFLNLLPQKVFGCVAFVHKDNAGKLDPRAIKCIFVGYSSTQKGYRCYCPILHKYFVTMNVSFFETKSYFPKASIQGEISKGEWLLLNNEMEVPNVTISPQSASTPDTEISFPILDISTPANTNQQCVSQLSPNRLISRSEPNPNSATNNSSGQDNCNETRETCPNSNKDIIVYSGRKGGNAPIAEQQCVLETDQMVEEPINVPKQGHESNPSLNSEELDLPIALRKGVRSCTQHPIGNYVSYEKLSSTFRLFTAKITAEKIPENFQEAIKDPNWKEAVNEELKALEKNQTWVVTDLPTGKRKVGCKWVFTIKYNSNGSINRYKARLVAKGFTQTQGIDYQETFAPVAKFNTIKILLSVAANLDWPLYQLDVKNAFLNGDLEEEVYMELPPGLNISCDTKVCRLKKSLYGLKQSPRAWFERFTKAVRKLNYHQCQTDHTLFVHHTDCGKIVVLIVYVDDIIITGDDKEGIATLKNSLTREFEVKDLGHLKYFLGMEIARSKKGISVSQRKYTLDLLKETGMLGAKPAETPMDSTYKENFKKEGNPVDRGRYQRLVGRLIYLSHTRPDISFPVSVVSQFMSNPQTEHQEAVSRILRYLKSTPGKGLFFEKGNSRGVEIYTDADWAGSVVDRRSTTGYCTFVWGNLVTWRSKKQPVVARSSAESEYRALALGICEGMWIRRVLAELNIDLREKIKVWCDNMATIGIANNPIHHDRTKHVEIDRHFIKEKIDSGIIDLAYMPTRTQVADMLTKALTRARFEELNCKLGMIDIYSPA